MQGTSARAAQNRVQEITEITTGLKALAKELGVPIIALSQLSRQVEGRDDKRPQLSDLRESGSIEQDADIVLFIYREDYYLKAVEPDFPLPEETEKQAKYEAWKEKYDPVAGRAELHVAKQRHGATGKVKLKFESRITRFSDHADAEYLPEIRG